MNTTILKKKFATIKDIITLTYVFVFSFFAATVYAGNNDEFTFSKGVAGAPKSFSEIVCIVVKLSLDFVPYLVVIAVGAFLQGLVKYVGHGDNEEKKGEGIKMMVYGSLGFFFMVGVWGVLSLFTNSFGIKLAIPQFKSDITTTCYTK